MQTASRVALALLWAVAASGAWSAELWRDDFRAPRTYETWGPRCWTPAEGAMRFGTSQQQAWLIPRMDETTEATARTRLSIARRLAEGYVWAGLILLETADDQWQLSLVEGPDGQRYFELIERLRGHHQAQLSDEIAGARLAGETTGSLATWEHDAAYELELALTPDAITGTITDPRTGDSWRRTYSLTSGRAVKRGRLGLVASGTEGSFGSLSVDGAVAPEQSAWSLPAGPLGTVALISDEDGTLAARWSELLTREGYGVLTVGWDDLLRGPLPRVDLLLAVDARRLPLEARDAVTRAVRRAGKVLLIGAPAFSELLVHTPGGWVPPSEYHASLLGQLESVPLALSGAWQRGAQYLTKLSTIEPAPEEGPDAWRLTFDYEGWDGFATDIGGAFGADRSVLTFEAKGDGHTSQMLVEVKEKDGSRWIATVPLTDSWRTVVLWPQDFPYWKDSTASRGQPGDRFHPQDVASITLGLAGSHTKKVLAGPHSLWVRQVATAADPGAEEPDFSLPQLETVSPSYAFFPLAESTTVVPAEEQCVLPREPLEAVTAVSLSGAAYSPVWRPRGRGYDRAQAARWVPILEVRDDDGTHRGAVLSLTIGDARSPDAMWAGVSVADPEVALSEPRLREAVMATAKAMTTGCFLVEGGARYFSCAPGEELEFGAIALNAGREGRRLTTDLRIAPVGSEPEPAAGLGPQSRDVPSGERAQVTWTAPAPRTAGTYDVVVTLLDGDRAVDRIVHQLVVSSPSAPEATDFVSVEGSEFRLHGRPWYFQGINYYPTSSAGRTPLPHTARDVYDPEILERDLDWMQSVGINAISAVYALQPQDPTAPGAFRDQTDFLDRCERHGIKVFLFVPYARPFADANPEWVKEYITRAGLADHSAVMCWELSWEPIHGAWGVPSGLTFLEGPWNAWVIQRYGSLESALADWGFRPQVTASGGLPVPTQEMTVTHGAWDPMVAAFRRAWSDIFSQAYREVIEPIRAFDPRHLISFRFGACGLPSGQAFAHAHSVGVLKHVDFLCPEGYSLMRGWGLPTPAEDLRRGGVITHYFRHFSGEKPVVWMEFGYTVKGIDDPWTQDRLTTSPEELANQVAEYEALYAMMLESGSRGAAPWWLPGGFRLGENSDFGVVEPDGSERPVCRVIRDYLPRFGAVRHEPPTAHIDMDLDTHYADAWQTYSDRYLELVHAGERPAVRTAGTGTDSASCPLTAVGGRPYSGTNPPIYLNAEYNLLEIRSGDGPWQAVRDGDTVRVAEGQPVRCRASVGNLGEAAWLALPAGREGGVFLAGRAAYGLAFAAPIEADTPFLGDATVLPFELIPGARGETTVSFEMMAQGRAYFGERRTVRIVAEP